MTEPTTEPGKWLVAEYARTPGDPKWYPGLGLESTVIAIEAEAFASLDARYAAQLNLTIKANSTIEDLREELHAAHEHRRVVEEYMAAPDPAPLDVERLRDAARRSGMPINVTVADIENLVIEYNSGVRYWDGKDAALEEPTP